MKKLIALCIVLVALSVPAFAQSDTTSTILEGLQRWGSTAGTPAETKGSSATTLDSLKAKALTKAGMYAIDTDKNGTVSKEELTTVTNRLFVLADKDSNGQLTEEELTSFSASMNKVLSFLY